MDFRKTLGIRLTTSESSVNIYLLPPRPLDFGLVLRNPRSGYFLRMSMRVIVFVDGQNLYRQAKNAWRAGDGVSSRYSWPSYDVEKLANALVAQTPGRRLVEIRFYTGVPKLSVNPHWHAFWSNKIRSLRRRGIYVYRGRVNSGGQEKGVDVSLSLDLVVAAYERRFDVAIIVSQDSDFAPAVEAAKRIAQNQGRSLRFESAFPAGPGSSSSRGVRGTKWVPIDKSLMTRMLGHDRLQRQVPTSVSGCQTLLHHAKIPLGVLPERDFQFF